jgi:CHAT domain-containing protein/predicted negative regulator of RcsB-dependent stress response
MSVEEAKQVTVSMSGEAFVPPPRRIDDILTILAQPGRFDQAIKMKHLAMAEKNPPQTRNQKDLANFYLNRGQAAAQLGRYNQALTDFRTALNISERAGISNAKFLERLGALEKFVGNFKSAIELLELSLSKSENPSTYRNLVTAYARIGDLESAERCKNRGVYICNQLKGPIVKALAARMQAEVFELKGNFNEAEKQWRKGLSLEAQIKRRIPGFVINIRAYLAQSLMNQNRLIEAELEIRRALKEAIGLFGKASVETGWIIAHYGKILQTQCRIQEAEKIINAGIDITEDSNIAADSFAMGQIRVLLGNVLADQQKFSEAMLEYERAQMSLIKNQFLYEKGLAQNPSLILTMLKNERTEEAMKLISNTYHTYQTNLGRTHYLTTEMLALQGMAYLSQKKFRQAVDDFSKSIPTLMTANTASEGNCSRSQRFKNIGEAYLNLLAQIYGNRLEQKLSLNAAAEAFRLADALRSHVVQYALGASGARVSVENPVLADLVRREQDTDHQIKALQSILSDTLAAPEDQRDPAAIENLTAKLDTLSRAHRALLVEIKKLFPKYSDFTNPQPATISMVKKHLQPNEALISIYTTDDHSYVWAIPSDGEIKFSESNMGKKKITRIVNQLRIALAPDPETLGDIPAFDLQQAFELYNHLLKPVEAAWKEAKHLIIVAHGSLGQLPFAVLPTAAVKLQKDDVFFANYRDIPWLIRKVSITRQPSVSSFITLRSLPQGNPERKAFAGFGDPFFNKAQLAEAKKEKAIKIPVVASLQKPLQVRGIRITDTGNLDSEAITSSHLGMLNRLPDTSDEILSIASALEADLSKDVFLGPKASEQQVKTMDLSDRRVIAFATHALVPGDLDGLNQPALALCSPEVTGEKEDGLLTLGEILKLKLNADWVVLSACNTGAADGAGAEAVSGLGRAFFYAGSRALLVSMWPVETTSARQLTSKLFEYQKEDKTLSRAGALRQSILALIDSPGMKDAASGKIAASYAHPFFWAPFIIVGDSGNPVN